MANSVDPDRGAESVLRTHCFASMIHFISNVRQLFAADDFGRLHFQMHFFSCRFGVERVQLLVSRG